MNSMYRISWMLLKDVIELGIIKTRSTESAYNFTSNRWRQISFQNKLISVRILLKLCPNKILLRDHYQRAELELFCKKIFQTVFVLSENKQKLVTKELNENLQKLSTKKSGNEIPSKAKITRSMSKQLMAENAMVESCKGV